jgi:hypothetical protein
MTKVLMRSLELASNRLFAARYNVHTEDYVEPANLSTVDRCLVFGDMVRLLELRPAEPGDAPTHRLSSPGEAQSVHPQADAFPATAG